MLGMLSKNLYSVRLVFGFAALHLFTLAHPADNSDPSDQKKQTGTSENISDTALCTLVARLPKVLAKKTLYMAENQGKIFTGIKPGSLLESLTPVLAVTQAGQEFLARCQSAKNKPIESDEVAAITEVLNRLDMHLPANFAQQDTSPVKLMQRLADSFGYKTIPTSCDKRMVFNRLFPRKSACQKFNDFASRVLDRLNS